MKIAILAAGAGGMYCGSCLRDSALATALKRLGHEVTLIPLYTPLRTESDNQAVGEVFYGGVNVYLQHASSLFRHTPRALDWIFDRPWILNLAGSLGAQTSPAKLAEFTLDVIRGEEGAAQKELRRLVSFIKADVKPDVVCIPNVMFIGMARTFRQELDVPVVCELTGEDIFLDAMSGEDRERLAGVIRSRVADVSRFVATSQYYAQHMMAYLGIGPEQMDVNYTGVPQSYLQTPLPSPAEALGRAPTVGYLARICPEKGFDQILEAMAELVELPGMAEAQLKVAGYLGSRDEKWAKGLLAKVAKSNLKNNVLFLGEVSLEEKMQMLASIDVLSVPTRYPESKGVYVLEAMSQGVPVVQPDHGAFPELVRLTGGGLLTPPNDPTALASNLARLLGDAATRRTLGLRARQAVASLFTDEQMALGMLKIFQSLLDGKPAVSTTNSLPAQALNATQRVPSH